MTELTQEAANALAETVVGGLAGLLPGMQPGVMYRIINPHTRQYIDGHFLNGVYWDNYRRIGELKGAAFYYYASEGSGAPRFQDNLAGHVRGLALVMVSDPEDVRPLEAVE